MRPIATVAKWVGAAVAIVAVSAAAVAGYAVWDVAASFKPGVHLVHSGDAEPPGIGALDGGVNFLLTGDDSGDGDAQYGPRTEKLNDVTILVHLASDHKNATVVTFPRDLMVPISQCPKPGGGHYGTSILMMNNAYAYGGLPCAAKTVEDLTGLTISYAADIGFTGVVSVADIIGGVRVCVADPIKDAAAGLDLPAGEQTLKGAQVVAFLRSRHGIGDGSDLGRISNQQLFFSALVRQTRDQLSNLPRVYAIAKTAAANLTVSDNFKNVNTMVSIALAFKDIDFDKIVFVQYPNHYQADSTGKKLVMPTVDAANILNAALRADKPVALTGSTSGQQQATQLDPNASGQSSSPTPSSSASDAGSTVDLPSDVLGQTAAQETCTRGYHF